MGQPMLYNGPVAVLYDGLSLRIGFDESIEPPAEGRLERRDEENRSAQVRFPQSDEPFEIDYDDLTVGFFAKGGARAFCIEHAGEDNEAADFSERIMLGETDPTGFATPCVECGRALIEDTDCG